MILFTQAGINLFHHHNNKKEANNDHGLILKMDDHSDHCSICSLQACQDFFYHEYIVGSLFISTYTFHQLEIQKDTRDYIIAAKGRSPPTI
jgi:hypothetical protein